MADLAARRANLEALWLMDEPSFTTRVNTASVYGGPASPLNDLTDPLAGIQRSPLHKYGHFSAGQFPGPAALVALNATVSPNFPGKIGQPPWVIGGGFYPDSGAGPGVAYSIILFTPAPGDPFHLLWDRQFLPDRFLNLFDDFGGNHASWADNNTTLDDWNHWAIRATGPLDVPANEYTIWINGVQQATVHVIAPPVTTAAGGDLLFGSPFEGYAQHCYALTRAVSDADMRIIAQHGIVGYLNGTDESTCPTSRTAAEVVALQETAATGVTDIFARDVTAEQLAALECTAAGITGV